MNPSKDKARTTKAQPTEPPTGPAAPAAARRLDRAPGERYVRGPGRPAAAGTNGPGGAALGVATGNVAVAPPLVRGSLVRSVVLGVAAAALGLLVFEALAVPLAFDTGLIVVALFTGRIIGLGVRSGARASLSRGRRVGLALVIAALWLVAAEVVNWLFAHAQGGVLPLGEYLIQAYGFQVVVQIVAAVAAAGISAR